MSRSRGIVALGSVLLGIAVGVRALADCGASGNSLWVFWAAATPTRIAAGPSGIWLTVGTKVSLLSRATGTETNFTTFPGVTFQKPACFRLRYPISSPATQDGLVLVGSNGYAYLVHPVTLTEIWSRSTRKDVSYEIKTPAVVQMWESSNAAFQAVRSEDLVIVGTAYSGTTSANRIYGLNGANGAILWLFNSSAAQQMNTVNGIALDGVRNLVYAVTEKDMTAQNTVWAISTINGAKIWARDLGAFDAEPVLAAGRLYVATRAGELYALDPATGATLSQTTVTTTDEIRRLAANTASGQVTVYAVDSGGTLHAYADPCSGFVALWTFKPGIRRVSAAPAFLGNYVYAGADDGRTWQIRASDGFAPAYATVSGAGTAPSYDPLMIQEGEAPRLIAHSGGSVKKLCVPWPHTAGDKAFLLDPPFHARPSMLLGFFDSFERGW